MRYLALACDYDGTLALNGRVCVRTTAALGSLLATGRRLILVTGRELGDLLAILPQIGLFEWVVAENGALLYCPATRETKVLAPAPPPTFAHTLEARGVRPISVGHVIVATWHPHEATVLATIRDLGLELQVIFNKGAVMVLPASVSKATGFAAALKQMALSPHEVIGVGDAENDHAFLAMCECSVAVANALPAVKQAADLTTRGDHGDGVVELIEQILADDLKSLEGRLSRHDLLLGTTRDGAAVKLPSYGLGILVTGSSTTSRSTVAAALLKQLSQQKYQFCLLDCEALPTSQEVIQLGDKEIAPTEKELVEVLMKGESNVVVNLGGLPAADRLAFLTTLSPQLLGLRARTGRPHWMIINDAHDLLPATAQLTEATRAEHFHRSLLITEHPEQLNPTALAGMGTVIAVDQRPATALAKACHALRTAPPSWDPMELAKDEVLLWRKFDRSSPVVVRIGESSAHPIR